MKTDTQTMIDAAKNAESSYRALTEALRTMAICANEERRRCERNGIETASIRSDLEKIRGVRNAAYSIRADIPRMRTIAESIHHSGWAMDGDLYQTRGGVAIETRGKYLPGERVWIGQCPDDRIVALDRGEEISPDLRAREHFRRATIIGRAPAGCYRESSPDDTEALLLSIRKSPYED